MKRKLFYGVLMVLLFAAGYEWGTRVKAPPICLRLDFQVGYLKGLYDGLGWKPHE